MNSLGLFNSHLYQTYEINKDMREENSPSLLMHQGKLHLVGEIYTMEITCIDISA